MLKLKIKVGHCYKFKFSDKFTTAFAVLYGFERGKNKDVYTLKIYNSKRDFEFPVEESTFYKWSEEGRIKEITPEKAMLYAL